MRRRATTLPGLVVLAAAIAAACAGAAPDPAPSRHPTTPARTPAQTRALPTAGGAPTVAPASASPSPATTIDLELVADGLSSPLFAGGAGDGSGRLFVVEQGGAIRVIRDGHLLPEPFLDLRGQVSAGGEQGLLGLAFAPTFASDGRLFVDYTDLGGNTVVAEYRTPDPASDRADPASARVLLRIDQPYPNHNGGSLVIGPEGLLWIGTGDGGSAGDPLGNGRRLDTLLAKLLRIDPRPTGDRPYRIPADNPFVGRPDARGEIWATGLRNPWRFSFDRATGDLWIGDVGQDTLEEVDRWRAGSPAGPDFGWSTMEGSACYRPASGCDPAGLVLPVAEYGHDAGCAVTGGYVYRGSAVPGLAGTYLYADFCSGTVWGLDAAAERPEPRVLLRSGLAVASFGVDDHGELYVVDLASGRVMRVVAARG